MPTVDERSPVEIAADRSDEQLARDLEQQQLAEAAAKDRESRTLEELSARLREVEQRLHSKPESQLVEERATQDATMAERVRLLEAAVIGSPGTPAGGSGIMITVRKGDCIAYRTDLGRGRTVQGGWVRCSRNDGLSEVVSRIGFAMHDFQYDEALGAPYHQVKHQVWKKKFKSPNQAQVVGPDRLIENIVVPSGPNFGIANAGGGILT